MGKPKNLGKDVSLRKLAEELGTHRNRIRHAVVHSDGGDHHQDLSTEKTR